MKSEMPVSMVVVNWKAIGLLVRNKSIQEEFQGFYTKLALSQGFLNWRYYNKSFKQGSENSGLKSTKRSILS